MKINEKIRIFRKEANLSQQDMAEKLNISAGYYGQLERGDVKWFFSIDSLKQIAEILGVNIEELKEDVKEGETSNVNDFIYYILTGKFPYQEREEEEKNLEDLNEFTKEVINENQRLQLIIEHKNELLERQKQEIELLKEMIHLLKQQNAK